MDLDLPPNIKENDRVLIRESEGVLEVLVYESCSSDSWLQESIIEKQARQKVDQ